LIISRTLASFPFLDIRQNFSRLVVVNHNPSSQIHSILQEEFPGQIVSVQHGVVSSEVYGSFERGNNFHPLFFHPVGDCVDDEVETFETHALSSTFTFWFTGAFAIAW
jgi:hypothetical protein